jgi:hypothetical protein
VSLALWAARNAAIEELEKIGWELLGAGVGLGGWDASFLLDRYSTHVSFDGEGEYRVTWYDEDRSGDDPANDDAQCASFTSFAELLAFAPALTARWAAASSAFNPAR